MSSSPSFTNLASRTAAVTPNVRAATLETPALGLDPTLVDGAFEGGGALGAAYIGALRALHDHNIWFARTVGNSAGAITAAMVAVGFSAPELQWLCSAYPDAPSPPPSLATQGITSPMPFESFLDLPSFEAISERSRRKSLLWQALHGAILEEIGEWVLSIPTRSRLADAVVEVISALPLVGPALAVPWRFLRSAVNTALALLPAYGLHLRDFLPDTDPLREEFADAVWEMVARNLPLELVLANLLYEGSVFEGDRLLQTLRAYFGRKVHGQPDTPVLFADLKIPLAVIASDLRSGQMLVYSSQTDPGMEVAEAVRRSMSVPFVFQPRGDRGEIVDGALCSNFPLWLYTAGGRDYWAPAVIDDARPKIGFMLEETRDAQPEWNVEPPRFRVDGDPPRVNDMEVLKPILVEKLKELRLPSAVPMPDLDAEISDLKLAEEAAGVLRLVIQAPTPEVVTAGLMASLPYYHVAIPLLGYHWLDFGVNGDEAALFAMWDRSWHAMMTVTGTGQGAQPPLIVGASAQQSPFRVP